LHPLVMSTGCDILYTIPVQVGVLINQGVSMGKNALLVAILVIASVAVIAIGVLQLAPTPGASAPDGSQQAALGPTPSIADVRRISVSDLHAKLQGPNPPLVWDLRSIENYTQQHIPGARLVLLSELPELARGIDRKQAIVTLCA
jgi:hypothetical protein